MHKRDVDAGIAAFVDAFFPKSKLVEVRENYKAPILVNRILIKPGDIVQVHQPYLSYSDGKSDRKIIASLVDHNGLVTAVHLKEGTIVVDKHIVYSVIVFPEKSHWQNATPNIDQYLLCT